MSLSSGPSQSSTPLEMLENLGFQIGGDGIIRGDEIKNCTIQFNGETSTATITSPDGQRFIIEGVKGVSLKKLKASGVGNVGFIF
jgi:hypothetical protein